MIFYAIDFTETQESGASEEDGIAARVTALVEMICRADDDAGTKSAALLVLMSIFENATHPKALSNVAKHVAFTRCGEINFHGVVDAQIAMLENELLAGVGT